ncbi:UvrB/UvrC motif-containing protein [candidate division NPL-UPA2 bacterium]|nr:UvrB/UvrC motif-containing protein [candidate division NPL-UPA2 bacterium]
MLCEICGKSQATVHYTEIINNESSETHLCEDCARKKGAMLKPHFPLADLLSGLIDFNLPLTLEDKGRGKCPQCGLTYSDFKKIGRLGCGQCYDTFKESLAPLLKRVHGSNEHVGKSSALAGKAMQEATLQLRELQERLQKAIQREEFEEAARLRDRIREIEKKTRKSAASE